jgi:uncharacterized OsmC-like protein
LACPVVGQGCLLGARPGARCNAVVRRFVLGGGHGRTAAPAAAHRPHRFDTPADDHHREERIMRTTTPANGIDVDQLLQTIGAVQDDPNIASFTFRAASTWQDGTLNTGRIHGFTHAGSEDTSRDEPFEIASDEPPVLLGRNQGPNAVELVLQALGFCYAVGYVANAAARGIDIDRMDYEVEGDIDVRSFLGQDGPRPGFTEIRVTGTVSSSNAGEEQLTELCQDVQDTSPVRDIIANPVPVHTSLQVV